MTIQYIYLAKPKKNEPKEAKRVAKYVILWNYVSGIS